MCKLFLWDNLWRIETGWSCARWFLLFKEGWKGKNLAQQTEQLVTVMPCIQAWKYPVYIGSALFQRKRFIRSRTRMAEGDCYRVISLVFALIFPPIAVLLVQIAPANLWRNIACTICCTLLPRFLAIGIGAEYNVQVDGCGCQLLISILLTMVSCWTSCMFYSLFSQLGFLPGIIHAFWVVMKADTKAESRSNTVAWSGLKLGIKKECGHEYLSARDPCL